jgi:hypothetical protein
VLAHELGVPHDKVQQLFILLLWIVVA